MKNERLIRRYEHNYFRGWVFATKRKGKRYVRYFSEKPAGRMHALREAQNFRDKLIARLPRVSKVKSSYVSNKTGVIGVARTKERTRSGRVLLRYVASWPKRDNKPGRATFSIGRYGEKEAFRLAIAARRKGLAEFDQE